MDASSGEKVDQNWRRQLNEIIFETDTPAGKAFDVVLMSCRSRLKIMPPSDSARDACGKDMRMTLLIVGTAVKSWPTRVNVS